MSDTKPYPSILQGFLLIVPFVLFTVLLAIAYIVIEEQFSFKTTAASLLELIAYVLVLAALIYFANKRRKYSGITAGFNFNIVPLKIIIISVAVVFSANIVTELFFYFFPPGESFVEFYEEAMSGGVPSIVAAVIAAPVLEEILMRGIILDGFLKRYTPAKAIIWSALIFAVFHLNLWQGVSAFTFGLLAGWLYWKTRSLSLCILLHAFGNGMSVVQYKAIGTISLTEYLGTGKYTVAFVTALILLIGCLRYMDIYFKKRQVSVVGNSAELPV